MLKFKGIGCSYYVLSLISGNDLVRLGSMLRVISKNHVNGEIHNQIGNLVITCGNGFQQMMVICFYSTIAQDTSVNQNIRVTWNSDRDAIIDISDYMAVIGPVC